MSARRREKIFLESECTCTWGQSCLHFEWSDKVFVIRQLWRSLINCQSSHLQQYLHCPTQDWKTSEDKWIIRRRCRCRQPPNSRSRIWITNLWLPWIWIQRGKNTRHPIRSGLINHKVKCLINNRTRGSRAANRLVIRFTRALSLPSHVSLWPRFTSPALSQLICWATNL